MVLIFIFFICPVILLIFRNTEFISSLLVDLLQMKVSIIKFRYDSNFRNLRIITFRKSLGNLEHDLENDS